MKRQLVTLIVATLLPMMGIQSAQADQPSSKTPAWSQLTSDTQNWILGSQVRAYECYARPTRASLSLKTSAGWIEVARTNAVLDPTLCANPAFPYAAKYRFVLNIDGQQDFPTSQAKLLVFQVTTSQGSRQHVSAVYQDSEQMSEDQVDGKLPGNGSSEESDQQAQTDNMPKPTQPKISVSPLPTVSSRPLTGAATSSAPSGWGGCSFNGVPMFGRVKVVSVGGTFKIRFVRGNADLKVKAVGRASKKCGEWQFVSSSPAFTVSPVQSGEDFTVSLGATHPGVNN